MKFALSLTLMVSLVASALPVTALETDPLSRAITREAVRLAAASETTSSSVDAAQPGGTSARSDWPRVLRIVPATEIVVIVKGSQPVPKFFVLADEVGLTVLNVADLTLHFEFAARRVLLNLASLHPEYFTDAGKAGEFVDNNVRVGPNGVFVSDRKVADLGQVVERIARPDVVEIKTAENADERRVQAVSAAIGGALIGYFGGAMAGARIFRAAGADPSNLGFIVWGGGGGGVAGGMLAYRAARHRAKDRVIYRAP